MSRRRRRCWTALAVANAYNELPFMFFPSPPSAPTQSLSKLAVIGWLASFVIVFTEVSAVLRVCVRVYLADSIVSDEVFNAKQL